MNTITIAGNLGADAETRSVGQDTVTSFSVADSKKTKSGEATIWFRCNLWNKRGEALAPYLKKGTPVTVVGELSQREYEKDGEKRHALEVRVSDVALQGKREGGERAPATRAPAAPEADDEGIPF
jgi:single-strand DNA-binding protein